MDAPRTLDDVHTLVGDGDQVTVRVRGATHRLTLHELGENGETVFAFGRHDPDVFHAAVAELTEAQEQLRDVPPDVRAWMSDPMEGVTAADVRHATWRMVVPWCANRDYLDDPTADPERRRVGICDRECGSDFCAEWGTEAGADALPGEPTFDVTVLERNME
jgi:hypothetical protein